jgi:hypothetical protein
MVAEMHSLGWGLMVRRGSGDGGINYDDQTCVGGCSMNEDK